jgi:ATPase subunit of ABC transporter with duplicated ATPase domains
LKDISSDLSSLRKQVPATSKMKMDLNSSSLHKSKVLVRAININFSFYIQPASSIQHHASDPLWPQNLHFQITSESRVVIKGRNGSGKTTLIKLILGELEPTIGTIERAAFRSVYIDQDYSLIKNELTVFEQVQLYNNHALEEHEVKIRLNRFLFGNNDWDKRCASLSGGERMRLMLSCLMISNQMPDVIILDEPTNNLDLENIQILTAAIKEYQGSLIVISHDELFLKEIAVTKEIEI